MQSKYREPRREQRVDVVSLRQFLATVLQLDFKIKFRMIIKISCKKENSGLKYKQVIVVLHRPAEVVTAVMCSKAYTRLSIRIMDYMGLT